MNTKNILFTFLLLLFCPLIILGQITVNFKADTISGCAPLIINFTDLSTSTGSAITSREWTFGNGSSDKLNNSVTTSATYINPGTYTVELKVKNANNQTETKTITNFITVFAKPTALFSEINIKTGCSPFTVNFKDSTKKGSGLIANYTWFFGDGSTSNDINPSKTFTTAKTYNISLQVTDVNGCVSNFVKPGYIVVKNSPTADFEALGQTGSCSPPLQVDFQNKSVETTLLTYKWNFGNGVISSKKTPDKVTYSNIGKYDVSLEVIDTNGCKDTLIKKDYINLGASSTASFTLNKLKACPKELITIVNNSTGATDYLWDFGDGSSSTIQTPALSYKKGGTYTIHLTTSISGACISKDSTKIEIDSIQANFISSPTTACTTPVEIQYTDKSINAVSWKWFFGNGATSTAKNPKNTINTLGSFNDQLIVSNASGCSDTLSVNGNITIEKLNPFFTSDIEKGCIPLTINFNDSTVSKSKIVSWSWDFGNGKTSNLKSPSTVFENAGKFQVKLTIKDSSGCEASITDSVKAGTKQNPDFIAVPDKSCAFAPVVFSDRSSDPALLDEWIWEFGDGASSEERNPIHQYQDTGKFTVKLKAGYNGCFEEISKDTSVMVSGPISSYQMDVLCDKPFEFQFKPDFKNVTRFEWDFGDGSPINTTDSAPKHVFPDNIDYTVKLKTYNDTTVNFAADSIDEPVCYYKYENTAQVRKIKADYTANSKACAYEAVVFDATNSEDVDIDLGTSHSYEWDFGDGTPISKQSVPSVIHQFSNTGLFKVKLKVTDIHNCSDSITKNIRVYHPTAKYSADKLYGCTPLKVNFSNSSIGDTTLASYNWDFGDGKQSNLLNPSNIYSQRGRKSVQLIVTDVVGCHDTLLKTDFIYPMKPIPDFTADTKLCKNANSVFVNNSAGDQLKYKWNFGDSQTDTSSAPIHTYSDTGHFNITLIATDSAGCDSSTTKTKYIHVQDIPVANFFADKTVGDCFPFPVSFQDSSISPYISALSWDFGDTQNAFNDKKPKNNYLSVGVFDVTLTVATSYGCLNSITKPKYITVKGPVADFEIEKEDVCFGDTIKYAISNFNNNIGDIIWNLDDGINKTNLKEVKVVYPTSGTKNISLVIKDGTNQCAITFAKSLTVHDIKSSFNTDKQTVCPGTPIKFTNTSDLGNYLWDFGNGQTDSVLHAEHTFGNSGNIDSVYKVNLIATSAFNCKDTSSAFITVFPSAISDFTSSISDGCEKFDVAFKNKSSNQKTYHWDFGNGKSSSSQNPSESFLNTSDSAQTFLVKLATSTINNCSDSTFQIITVYPKPDFPITSAPDSGCSPLSVNFNAAPKAVSSIWDFGDGSARTIETNPSHIYLNESGVHKTVEVMYIGTSEFGCKDTSYSNIKVFFNPIADFNLSSALFCTPFENTINNSSQGGVKHYWNFGDGSSLDTTGLTVKHLFSNNTLIPISYQIQLITESSLKCTDTIIKTVTVNPPITSDFSCDTIICSGQTVSFENKSKGNDSNSSGNIWNYGTNQDFQEFELSPRKFETSGIKDTTYMVRLVAISKYNQNCKDTLTKKILVKHNPIADFTKTEIGGCQKMTVQLKNISQGANSYNWQYGDTKSSDTLVANHNHFYENNTSNPISFNITLTAISNGCSNAKTQTIKVNPAVKASFNPISNGCSPQKTFILSNSTPGSSLLWEFEGGSPSTSIDINPEIIFTNNSTADKTYQIKLTAEKFGCKHDTTMSVKIFAQPIADFSADPIEQTFPDTVVNINNTSTLVSSWKYNWTFGDGKSFNGQQPIKHNYSNYGKYPIQLIVSTENCSDTSNRIITIKPHPPIASFNPLPASGCPPLSVTFKSTSEYAEQYIWEFGNGETSTEINPTYIYDKDGKYGIKLTVTGPGGTNTIFFPEVVTVYEKAKPQFDYEKTIGLYIDKSPVNFINKSTAANNYFWKFGDGDSSLSQNPVKYYQEKGTYTVLLIANNENGCLDSIKKDVNVYLKGVLFPNAFTPNPQGANGGTYDINNIQNEVFFPKFEGVKDYHLTIYNRWGELLFESLNVDKGWDGYYKGNLCQQDVYVWKVEVSFLDEPNKTYTYKGDITLLR